MSENGEGEMLEERLQADFSKGIIAEEGPLAMGLCYLRHLACKNPPSAAAKALVMACRYAQHLFRVRFGREELHDVFSIYAGMPAELIVEVAASLSLNPAFIEKARSYRKEHNLSYCTVDICTRDVSCLVDAFIETHRTELEEYGIRIGRVRGNTLEERGGVFTGGAKIPVMLMTKPLYLDLRIPYLTGKDEHRLYKGFMPNIVLV